MESLEAGKNSMAYLDVGDRGDSHDGRCKQHEDSGERGEFHLGVGKKLMIVVAAEEKATVEHLYNSERKMMSRC